MDGKKERRTCTREVIQDAIFWRIEENGSTLYTTDGISFYDSIWEYVCEREEQNRLDNQLDELMGRV